MGGLGGRLLEMAEYVERDADMDSLERVQVGLPGLARVYDAFLHWPSAPRAVRAICVNHIQPERAVEATSRGAAPIRSWDGALSDSAPELARFVGEVERELTRTLPRRPVHGDFWDNNVFSRDGRVVLVNDFDHMGVPARIDDVGLTLYFTHLEEGRGQLLGLVDAYVSGLRSLLTARRDRTRLPLALGRQPVWCIGGWVASVRDEAAAHAHTGGMHAAVDFALSIVRELSHWQAFA